MHKSGLAAVFGLSLAACSSGQESLDRNDESIIRATANGGRNEVVLIQVIVFDGSTDSIITRSCSGAYFAPRVVATAAHCLDADPALNQSVLQVVAYYGDAVRITKAQRPTKRSRGWEIVEHTRGRGTVKMTTDEIMQLLRGED